MSIRQSTPVPKKNKDFVFETDDRTIEASIDEVMRMVEAGDPDGLYAMGMAYLFGLGVEQDISKGYELLESASEKGQPDAMTLLVKMFMSHEYTGMDKHTAVEYSKKGAEAGISDAQLFLGIAYMD
ncbi:MAG: sel1 repeat family protein, partial [Candidatus Methanoplasma sp.]|nr:sel1 repeat family protein [Candidatus Methanoplasma sp.]